MLVLDALGRPPAAGAGKTLIELGRGGIVMSSFLRMLPRRLPVALADYVAVTKDDELERRTIARRIYAALPTEQQAETSRIYRVMSANARRTGNPSGSAMVGESSRWPKLRQIR